MKRKTENFQSFLIFLAVATMVLVLWGIFARKANEKKDLKQPDMIFVKTFTRPDFWRPKLYTKTGMIANSRQNSMNASNAKHNTNIYTVCVVIVYTVSYSLYV